MSGKHLRVVIGLCLVAGTVGLWRLFSELQRVRGQQAIVEAKRTAAAAQLRELEQKHAELSQTHEQLAADRDNLLAQVQRAFHERDRAEAERQLLEEVFRRTAAERLELLDRMKPFEEQLAGLERSLQQVDGERLRLERELAKAKDRSQERALRTKLAEAQQRQQDIRRALRDAKAELTKTSRREEKATQHLTTLTKRLDQLQHEYADEVSENASLRRKVERLPKDVTGLAREHERLLKDVADTHYNMGVMFAKKRDYVRAANEFRQVVELRPDDLDAHYNLGVIYAEHRPDREKAMKFFRKYLALNPQGQNASWAKQYIATWQAWEAKERLE